MGSNNHNDEENPIDMIGTDLSDRMSEQNDADIELDHIVQSGNYYFINTLSINILIRSYKRKTATNIN